jgi:hypothetical protein
LVKKELSERQSLDRKRPSYLCGIKLRDDIDGDVESNLRRREGVLRKGLRACIPHGGGWNNRRRHIQGGGNHDVVRQDAISAEAPDPKP